MPNFWVLASTLTDVFNFLPEGEREKDREGVRDYLIQNLRNK